MGLRDELQDLEGLMLVQGHFEQRGRCYRLIELLRRGSGGGRTWRLDPGSERLGWIVLACGKKRVVMQQAAESALCDEMVLHSGSISQQPENAPLLSSDVFHGRQADSRECCHRNQNSPCPSWLANLVVVYSAWEHHLCSSFHLEHPYPLGALSYQLGLGEVVEVHQLEEEVRLLHGVREEVFHSWLLPEVVEMGKEKAQGKGREHWLKSLHFRSKKAYRAMTMLLPFRPWLLFHANNPSSRCFSNDSLLSVSSSAYVVV